MIVDVLKNWVDILFPIAKYSLYLMVSAGLIVFSVLIFFSIIIVLFDAITIEYTKRK